MNPFIMENMVKDRIRDIEADVQKQAEDRGRVWCRLSLFFCFQFDLLTILL